MGEPYKTTLERNQDRLLDFTLESRRVVTEALDYIDIIHHMPLGEEAQLHLREIQRILKTATSEL